MSDELTILKKRLELCPSCNCPRCREVRALIAELEAEQATDGGKS